MASPRHRNLSLRLPLSYKDILSSRATVQSEKQDARRLVEFVPTVDMTLRLTR
jgi:hypothetical protein